MDEIDIQILYKLLANARSKLKDIANHCAISSTAVKNRIKRLRKNGVIVKASLNFDSRAIGLNHPVFIGINLEHDQEQNVIDLIKEHTIVTGIDRTIGKYNLCLFVIGKNVSELDNLKNMIRKQNGVRNIEISLWNKLYFNYDNIAIKSF